MEDWLTYRLSDLLLFSPRTYYRLFELHNRALWPAHVAAFAVGVGIVATGRRVTPRRATAVALLLGACWLWVAWAFHLERYATINWIAPYFAAAFAVQGLLLLRYGFDPRLRLAPASTRSYANPAALGLVVFALLVEPLIGPLVGREWTQLETFGAAPDPTAVATLGALPMTSRSVPRHLLIIPAGWCAISGATAWAMGSPDALVVPVAGGIGTALILAKRAPGNGPPGSKL